MVETPRWLDADRQRGFVLQWHIQEAGEEADAGEQSRYRGDNVKLLVVDDEDFTRRCISEQIDWNSYDELSEKGYFSEDAPPWVSFLGYLEVVGDVVQDKILSANYNIRTTWTDYRTKILE